MFTPHIKQPIRSNPTINANHISGAVPLRSKSIDFPVCIFVKWQQKALFISLSLGTLNQETMHKPSQGF